MELDLIHHERVIRTHALLDFLASAYEAGANLAKWHCSELET